MAKENLAEKPENYDVTAEVKASAVMTETEVQETVDSKTNDNMEGPQTPPKGKVEDKETANGDVSNVTPLTFAEVAKAKQLSPERLEEIIDAAENDNLFPTEKLNSQDLIDRVNILRAWVETEENKLKTAPFSISSYKSRRSVLQARAAYVLLIECYIGEQLKAIPKLKGTNKNSKCRVSGQMRTKTQIIQEDYELSSRQSRDFQHLTWDGVKAAIEIALRRNDIPTRDLALSKSASIKAKQNKSNNKIKHTKFELDNIEETEFKMLQLEKPMYPAFQTALILLLHRCSILHHK